MWVRVLSFSINVVLFNRPFSSFKLVLKSWETCTLIKFQVTPKLIISINLRVEEKGTKICISECRQGFTLKQNVSWVFLLCSTAHSVFGSDCFECRYECRLTLVYFSPSPKWQVNTQFRLRGIYWKSFATANHRHPVRHAGSTCINYWSLSHTFNSWI